MSQMQATDIPPTEAALVTTEQGHGQLHLYISEHNDDDDVPPMIVLLAAVLALSRYPDWVAKTIEQFEALDEPY